MEKINKNAWYNTVMPYLIIPGAAHFVEFAKQVFGAEEKNRSLGEDGITIRHGEIVIDGSCIMFAESTDQFPPQPAGLFVYVNNADESYKKALDAGGTSIMPPADQPYGRSCGVKDPCGNTWWITSV